MPECSPPDRRTRAAVHIDEITAGAEAIKKASVKMSDKLMDDIIKNFQKRVGATTLVQLTIFGLGRSRRLAKIQEFRPGTSPGRRGDSRTELGRKCGQSGRGYQGKRSIPLPGDEPEGFPGVCHQSHSQHLEYPGGPGIPEMKDTLESVRI